MFSANENLQLRQHKRRIVNKVESCMPIEIVDEGLVNVMVMQVTCRAPGCVPLETVVLIMFAGATNHNDKDTAAPMIPGLPESVPGGSYQTKILRPMADVTDQDVLEALPPAFEGGLRTAERMALQARDVMLAQITQLLGDTTEQQQPDTDSANFSLTTTKTTTPEQEQKAQRILQDKRTMALYLQQALQDYLDRDCVAPDYGEPFPPLESSSPPTTTTEDEDTTAASQTPTTSTNDSTTTPSLVPEKPSSSPTADTLTFTDAAASSRKS